MVMRSRDGRGRRRRGQRNASSWSSGCDDSAIEALFSAIGNGGGGKCESQDLDEEVVEERRRRARDPAKRKSVTFAECQEVLEMSE